MEKLGIDPAIILFQIVNFGILVFVLNKFLYKPVLKAIRSKKEDLEKVDKEKLELLSQREEIARDRDKILKEAQKEKAEILKNSSSAADKLKKEILAKAEKQAKNILDKAKNEAEADKKRAMKQYEKDVLEAAIAINKKVLGTSDKKALSDMEQIKSALLRN